MTWVITRLCRDCVDMTCLDVCPVDCIVQHTGSGGEWPNQLYIVPNECIDCGACETECPWEAIFEDSAVPPELQEDVELNRRVEDNRDQFEVPAGELGAPVPTPDQVAENRARWGVEV